MDDLPAPQDPTQCPLGHLSSLCETLESLFACILVVRHIGVFSNPASIIRGWGYLGTRDQLQRPRKPSKTHTISTPSGYELLLIEHGLHVDRKMPRTDPKHDRMSRSFTRTLLSILTAIIGAIMTTLWDHARRYDMNLFRILAPMETSGAAYSIDPLPNPHPTFLVSSITRESDSVSSKYMSDISCPRDFTYPCSSATCWC